jgi:hypothetical protein
MTTTEILSLLPVDGWVIGDQWTRVDGGRPIPDRVSLWIKCLAPWELGKLVGEEAGPVYAPHGNKEYRFEKIRLTSFDPWRIDADEMTVRTITADVLTPPVPATPFDGFLAAIDRGDLSAAMALVDRLEELLADGVINPHLSDGGHPDSLRRFLIPQGLLTLAGAVVQTYGGRRTLRAGVGK